MTIRQESFKAKISTYETELGKSKKGNQEIMEKMCRAEEELKKMQACDPASYAIQEPIYFKKMIGNIRMLKKVEPPKPRIAFVGMTNAGKSSLINALYGTNCEVSAVECTVGHTIVASTSSYELVDVYGYNDEHPYYTKEQIDNFLSLKAAMLLYTGSIQTCQRAIEMFKAARVEIVVVRSKADQEEPADLEMGSFCLGGCEQKATEDFEEAPSHHRCGYGRSRDGSSCCHG